MSEIVIRRRFAARYCQYEIASEDEDQPAQKCMASFYPADVQQTVCPIHTVAERARKARERMRRYYAETKSVLYVLP